MKVVYETECPGLHLENRGKVRDIYGFPGQLLLVATDRLSAFDVVSKQPIPEKGRILTEMTVFWFGWLASAFPWLKTHFITADWTEIVKLQPTVAEYEDQLAGRSMLVCRLTRIFGIEFVIRLFLYGSGWGDYRKTGEVCGIKLPQGMRKADPLLVPMFTPATKAGIGDHDENISVDEAVRCGIVTQLEAAGAGAIASLILMAANEFAKTKGIIIPDTKFELGLNDAGEVVLADEVLTPDSSRFWPADQYEPGKDQPSLDKQFVREYLEREVAAGRWDKTDPMPLLPDDIITGTTQRYLKCLEMLTGK